MLDDQIYEMRYLYLFVAVGPNALFIVLPHLRNMSIIDPHDTPPSHITLTLGQLVMFCGSHFIWSDKQAATTTIFKSLWYDLVIGSNH